MVSDAASPLAAMERWQPGIVGGNLQDPVGFADVAVAGGWRGTATFWVARKPAAVQTLETSPPEAPWEARLTAKTYDVCVFNGEGGVL